MFVNFICIIDVACFIISLFFVHRPMSFRCRHAVMEITSQTVHLLMKHSLQFVVQLSVLLPFLMLSRL